MKNSITSKLGHVFRIGALAATAFWTTTAIQGADILWSGGTASYTNAANWSGTVPGSGDNAINNNGTNNRVQINAGDPDWALTQLRADNGAFEQNGQTLTLSGTPRAFRLGIATGKTGVYTLNNGTVNYGNGGFNLGELGTAALNVNGGSIIGSGNLAINVGSSLGTVTSTMGGTNKSDYTWFEQGFYTPDAARGIPLAGSTFTSEALADHSYTMPANYAANNAVQVFSGVTSATITFTSPTAASALSFLGSSGFGTSTVNYTLHHADSTTETGTIAVLDWFDNAGTVAWRAGGRISADGLSIQIINDGPSFPYLLSFDVAVTNTTSPVTSVDLTYASGGVAAFLAVSSSTGGDFTPKAITGYNQDIIVEVGAPIYVGSTVTDLLNQVAGSINVTGEFWVGNYGAGVYNFAGGTNSFQNWTVLGRSGGHGTINMTGGEINKIGNGNFLIGTGYQAPNGSAPSGILNQSAGTINSQGEFSIPENSPATGNYNLSGTGVLIVNNWMQVGRSGGTGVMNMSGGSVMKTGGGNFIVGDNATGTLTQTGGSIEVTTSEAWIGQGGSAVGLYNMGGGSFACDNNWISIGRNGGNGTLNLTNGVFTKAGGGNFSIGGDGGATGTLNQFGGTISNAVNAGSYTFVGQGGGFGTWTMDGGTAVVGFLRLCENGSGSGTVNLNNGLLSVYEVNAGGASSTFNFNGGTLLARGDNANFFHDLGVASVQAGGAIFDSQGYNVTVAQSLSDGGGGGLAKNGAGTLTLTGANSYTGATAVNAGTLALRTDSTANGNYAVASGAQLSLAALALNAQLNVANLTLASPTPALGVDLGAFGNPTSAPLNVTGTFAVNGTITVNIADALPQVGLFPLIQYGTRTGSGNFVIGSLPPGVEASVVTNASAIAINITAVNVPRWEGLAGGNWDIGVTTNWINVGDGLPTTYKEGNQVTFDDNALGSTTVNLVATVNPSSVTANHSALNYTLNGAGKISGATGLTKQGTGTLTIANTGGNNYTGPTVISGGTVSVASLANGGAPSAIGASSAIATNLLFNGGALSYTGPAVAINRSYSVQAGGGTIDTVGNLTVSGLATAAPGSGFTKTGSAQLAYTGAGNNTLSGGAFVVRDGSLVLDGSAGGQTNTIPAALNLNGAVTAAARLTNTTLNCGDLYVGNESGKTGSLVIENGTTIKDNSWFILDNGTATINGGEITVPGRLFLCEQPGTTATLYINGGIIHKPGDYFAVVNGGWNGTGARTGVVYQVAGTVTGDGGEMWVGDSGGAGGNDSYGEYNLSGGSVTVNNWMGVGRDGCRGVFNLSGTGVFNKTGGGDMVIGRGGDNTIGTFNMSGGTLNKSSGNPLIIGQNSGHGLFNQSGGTLTVDSEYWVGVDGNTTDATNNISGTAIFNINNWLSLGRGGRAVVNFSGGQINKSGGGAFIVGDNGTSVFTQTGGTNDTFGELWIAQAGGGVGEYNLSNGVVTLHNWLAVGRESGKGTLNISGGSFTKDGNGNISITHNSGATGAVSITGGSFTCASGETWIGENGGPGLWNMDGGTATVGYVQLARNSDATGTLNLNGGTFTANEITTGSSGTSTLNFNGGTLGAGANTVNFLHGLTAANVQAGGAVINSGTNTISIAQPLLDGGGAGGLSKVGTGTLRLNGVNTYTGATLVSAGTLGGTGTIAGPVSVAAGASLAPGASIGTLTVNNSVTLGGTTAMEISKDGGVPVSDLLAVSGNLAFGGTLTVELIGTNALAFNDTFNLFDWGTRSGSFAAMNLPAGYVWDTSQLNVNGTIRVIGVKPPAISSSTVVGVNLIVTGVGGPPGASYTWITSTNVAAPIWTTNLTGVFDGTGAFSNAFPIITAEPTRFFRLQTP